ncbi:MAG: DNA cytosine methyltransferase [Verrucomicrobia bacterium]|nr:DNA cytosine methyltransferase [Verrucomicrobiota bacterium]
MDLGFRQEGFRPVLALDDSQAAAETYNHQFPAPASKQAPTVWKVLAGLPEPMFYRRDLVPEEIEFHPNHWAMNPRSAKFQNGIHGEGRSFRRLKWGRPSFTVAYGSREVHVQPNGKRRIGAAGQVGALRRHPALLSCWTPGNALPPFARVR